MIGREVNLRDEFTPRLLIPLDVRSLQTADEALDVAKG